MQKDVWAEVLEVHRELLDPIIKVDFLYSKNATKRSSARGGFLVEYADHVSEIAVYKIISADRIMRKLYAYDLVNEIRDSLDFLVELEREDAADSAVETIAKFEYSGIDDSETPTRTGTTEHWDSLGQNYAVNPVYWELDNCLKAKGQGGFCITEYPDGSKTRFEGYFAYSPSYAGTTKSLGDFNGDGLPDFIDTYDALLANDEDSSSDGNWTWSGQEACHDDDVFCLPFKNKFSWHDAIEFASPEKFQYQWSETEAPEDVDGFFGTARTNQTHMNIDIDGDGYPDQLVTHGRVSDNTESEWWVIYFGNGAGFDAATSVLSPGSSKGNPNPDWLYPHTSLNVKANRVKGDNLSMVDVERTLMDMNGDGWLDAVDPTNDEIYYHTGTRGGGWGLVQPLDFPQTAVRWVRYTFEDLDTQYDPDVSGDSCQRDDPVVGRVDCPESALDEFGYTYWCDEMCKAACVSDKYNCMLACDDDKDCLSGCGEMDESACANECESNYCAKTKAIRHYLSDGKTEEGDPSYVVRQRYVAGTDEIQAFYDMNGDGWPDSVSAMSPGWLVAINNGHGFEDPVSWDAPDDILYMRRSNEGFPSYYDIGEDDGDEYEPNTSSTAEVLFGDGESARVFQTMIDVDGDGFLDLALGADLGHIWYKNTGAGFESSARDLPKWWPDDFTVSTTGVPIDNDNPKDDDDWKQTSTTNINALMIDLDHDGAVDSMETDFILNPSEEVTPPTWIVKYGAYPPPNILIKVENAQGGKTDIAYRSLATVSPSGDVSELQHTPNIKHLVDTLSTQDTITGQNGLTSFSYEDGYYKEGLFQGFESRTVEQKINDKWVSKTAYSYELDRDFAPLTKQQKLYTDFNLTFGSTLSRGSSANKQLRYQVDTSFADSPSVVSGVTFYLPKIKTVTEYGEKSGSRKTSQSFNWNEYANLSSHTNSGDTSVENDEIVTSFGYVTDATEPYDVKFTRMSGRGIYGTNPLTGDYGLVDEEKYYYDDHAGNRDLIIDGLLTKIETWAGWIGGGESLEAQKLVIDYELNSRGGIAKATDQATGVTIDQTFDFGGAVVETQTNGLGHKLTQTIDSQGRVTSIKDPNGLTLTRDYDEFNRVIKKSVTGRDGKTYPLEDFTYSHTAMPYYTMKRTYNGATTADTTSYEVEDGFGNVKQSWQQNYDGKFLVTQKTFDVRGLPATTTHPISYGGAFSTSPPLNIPTYFGKAYYDALGIARETVRDSNASTGSQLIYFDTPGVEWRQDEEGYITQLTHDAHGNVTQVNQGNQGMLASVPVTAEYAYDPMGRIVSFTDPNDMTYKYSYDGAGRLRQVSYSGGATNASGDNVWYTYEYKGELMTKMTDATGAYAAREYDAIGRPLKLTTTDSLPSSPGTLEYVWDYDDNWIGAVYKSTDPSGSTLITHDALGHEDKVLRTYKAGSVSSPYIWPDYDHDVQGNLTNAVTYATGVSRHNVQSIYTKGFLTKQNASTSYKTDYNLTYTYNKWGLWDSVMSSKGHKYARTFTTPLWPDEFKLTYGAASYKRGYNWENNGLLDKRKITTPVGKMNLTTTYDYDHDFLKQLSSIKSVIPNKTIESYTYKQTMAGTLGSLTDASGITWTYPTGSNYKPKATTQRKSSTGMYEDYRHDAAGRLYEWNLASGKYEYYYDGLGRLRGIKLGGTWQMTFDYDAEGNLVRKGDNNPYTASPYYAYAFRNWRYDEKSKVSTLFDNSFVAAENGTRQWLFSEYDGHVTTTLNDFGTLKSSRVLGGYGSTVSSSGTEWSWNAFHGAEKQVNLTHMGQRHLMSDGQWLQPEPMLYHGIPKEFIAQPLGLAPYRYAMNSPTMLRDVSGFASKEMREFSPLIAAINRDFPCLIAPGEALDVKQTAPDEFTLIRAGGPRAGYEWEGFLDGSTFVQISKNGTATYTTFLDGHWNSTISGPGETEPIQAHLQRPSQGVTTSEDLASDVEYVGNDGKLVLDLEAAEEEIININPITMPQFEAWDGTFTHFNEGGDTPSDVSEKIGGSL